MEEKTESVSDVLAAFVAGFAAGAVAITAGWLVFGPPVGRTVLGLGLVFAAVLMWPAKSRPLPPPGPEPTTGTKTRRG